jgi:hypothetical protein
VKYRWLASLILLFSSVSGADPRLDLLPLSQVIQNPKLRQEYYTLLQNRFRNGDFQEILFPERPSITGPRLTYQTFEKTLASLQQLLRSSPTADAHLTDRPAIIPFQVGADGRAQMLQDSAESWKTLFKRLDLLGKSIRSGHILDNLSEADRAKVIQDAGLTSVQEIGSHWEDSSFRDQLLKALAKQFNRSKTPVSSRILADTLIGAEVSPAMMSTLSAGFTEQGFAQFRILSEFLAQARNRGTRLQLPRKIIENIAGSSSFADVPRSDFFKKGISFIPMTRQDAVFKGIGTGECVRSSCNRYVDALFDDSIHLSVLKDGREIGYVGIYKTLDQKTGTKVWALETLQFPNPSGGRLIDGLVRHLQALAVNDGAFLAVPAKSYNTYNFKENVADIEALPEVSAGQSTELDYQHPQQINAFEKKGMQELPAFNQFVADASGYKGKRLINAMTINGEKFSIVAPFPDQPDSVLVAHAELLNSRISKSLAGEKLSPLDRGRLYLDLLPGYYARESIMADAEKLARQGEKNTASALLGLIYRQLPENLRGRPFSEQLNYVDHQIKNVVMKPETAQDLKDELLLSAKTWEDYVSVLKLRDISSKYFPSFVFTSFDHFSALAPAHFDWIGFYQSTLGDLPNAFSGLQWSRKILPFVNSPDDYLKIVRIARGMEKGGRIGDKDLADLFTIETWEKYLPTTVSYDERQIWIHRLLSSVGNKGGISIRQTLLGKAASVREIHDILKGDSALPSSDAYPLILSKMTGDSITRVMDRPRSTTDILSDLAYFKALRPHLLRNDDYEAIIPSLLESAKTAEDLRKLVDLTGIPIEKFTAVAATVPAQKAPVIYEHPAQYLLEPNLWRLRPVKLNDAINLSNTQDAQDLIRKLSNASNVKDKMLLASSRLMSQQDAKSLTGLIRIAEELPLGEQKQIFSMLMRNPYVYLTDYFPEHQALKEQLQTWIVQFSRGEDPVAASSRVRQLFRSTWSPFSGLSCLISQFHDRLRQR